MSLLGTEAMSSATWRRVRTGGAAYRRLVLWLEAEAEEEEEAEGIWDAPSGGGDRMMVVWEQESWGG